MIKIELYSTLAEVKRHLPPLIYDVAFSSTLSAQERSDRISAYNKPKVLAKDLIT